MPRGIDPEEPERDRQREADRLASEANPPMPVPPEGCTVVPRRLNVTETVYCLRGTAFCTLKHDGTDPPEPTYAEQLKAWNERVKAGETKSHWTGD